MLICANPRKKLSVLEMDGTTQMQDERSSDSTSRYNKVYVFDTCSLMHYPDVPDDFLSNKALVIKLDGLKTADDEKRHTENWNFFRKLLSSH